MSLWMTHKTFCQEVLVLGGTSWKQALDRTLFCCLRCQTTVVDTQARDLDGSFIGITSSHTLKQCICWRFCISEILLEILLVRLIADEP